MAIRRLEDIEFPRTEDGRLLTAMEIAELGGGWNKDATMYLEVHWSQSYNGCCHICTLPIYGDISWDHLVPKRAGGIDQGYNTRAAHRSCNSRRSDGRIPAQLPLVPMATSFYDERFAR